MIRKTEIKDIPSVMKVIDAAKAYFKDSGIDQWQNGYPNEEALKADIAKGCSYVLSEEDQIVGTCFITFERDPYYTVIENGSWQNDEEYGVVHRIAVLPSYKGKGYAAQFIREAERQAKEKSIRNLRADTHADNRSMRRMLEKNGFVYCGDVYVRDHAPRIAFQKVLSFKE